MTNIQKDLFDAEEELMRNNTSFAVADDRHKVYYYKYELCAYEDKLSDTVHIDKDLDDTCVIKFINDNMRFINDNKTVKRVPLKDIEKYFEQNFRI